MRRTPTQRDWPAPPLPGWEDDPVYRFILSGRIVGEIEQGVKRQTLVEEYESSEDALCAGRVLRAWVREHGVVRAIPASEWRRHVAVMLRHWLYPFDVERFHLFPDRTRVVFGSACGQTMGMGGRYFLHVRDGVVSASVDEAGGCWIS